MPIEIFGEKILVISGKNEITSEMVVQYKNRGIMQVISYDAAKLGEGAFKDFPDLREIRFSNVQEIGEGAFSWCEKLEKVDLPELTVLGSGVFNQCKNLEEFKADKLRKITENSFVSCQKLKKIHIPEVIEIGNDAFKDCQKLEEFEAPKLEEFEAPKFENFIMYDFGPPKLQRIKASDFEYIKSLRLLIISRNCDFDERIPFSYTATYPEYLQDILINKKEIHPDYIKSHKQKIVYGTIPQQITDIKEKAFQYCVNLKKIEILENVETIGENAFLGCTNLKQIILPNKFFPQRAGLGIPQTCRISLLSQKYIIEGEIEKAIDQLIMGAEATGKVYPYGQAIELGYELLKDLDYNNLKNQKTILEKVILCADKTPELRTISKAGIYNIYSNFNIISSNGTDQILDSLEFRYAKKAVDVILDVAKEKLPIDTNDYSESDRELSQRRTEYVRNVEKLIPCVEYTYLHPLRVIPLEDADVPKEQFNNAPINDPINMPPREVLDNNTTIDKLTQKVDEVKLEKKVDKMMEKVTDTLEFDKE